MDPVTWWYVLKFGVLLVFNIFAIYLINRTFKECP